MSVQLTRGPLCAASIAVGIVLLVASAAQAGSVTSFVDTGRFNPDEMSAYNGSVYLTGYASDSSYVSVVGASSGGLTTLYSPLPGTTGGNLTYTNGFTADSTNLWWNNANSGPGSATEISKAPASGAGPIVRFDPSFADDLDSLSWSGTTMYTAYYAGTLYALNPDESLSYLGFHRSTSHLAIAGDGSTLYVVDDGGAYKRNANGSFTDINSDANTYRVNGSRLAVGDGYLYALDRNLHNGFYKISIAGGSSTFITDPSFTNLTSVAFTNGDLYLADTGELSGSQVNNDGHVWEYSDTVAPLPSPLWGGLLLFAAVAAVQYHRRGVRRMI